MNDSGFLRITGGIASILTSLFILAGYLLEYIDGTINGEMAGKISLFAAHIFVVFVFIAVFEKHKKEREFLAGFGLILGVTGTLAASTLVLMDIAVAAGVSVKEMMEVPVIKIIASTGIMLFAAALFCLGFTIITGRILSKWGGWLIVLGTFVLILGNFETGYSEALLTIGAAFNFGGFFLTGATLLKEQHGTELFIKRSI